MKIDQIITESLLFEQQLKEDPVYKDFYSAGMMLVEYKMSQEQIKQLFKAVADGAASGGNIDKEGDAPASNRTLLGKGADAASTITKAFDKVKTKISQSGPVSGFDVAFDNMQSKLLNAAGGDKGAIGKALAKYREFAHKNPVMQGAVYAGLIALAGISGAGLGGAAILGGIKVFDKLLQGDKASSALWSGFKTGAMAYGAGQLGQAAQGGDQATAANPADFGANTADVDNTTAGGDAGASAGGSWNDMEHSFDYTVKPGDTLSDILHDRQINPEIARRLNPELFGPDGNPNIIKAGQTIRLPNPEDMDTWNRIQYTGTGYDEPSYHGQYAANNPSSLDAANNLKQQEYGKWGSDNGMSAARAAKDAATLKQGYENPKPMLEYIDREATLRSWVLRESVGKPRGGVALTEVGRQAIFYAIVNEGPWDDIKQGAGKFVKGLGQGFTNPGVRNIKNLDTSQMAGAQLGAAGNKLAKGYGWLANKVQKGADAVGGVVKKGWDSASNKITYDKLDLNWRKNYKEFDPTGGKGSVDSEVVANFLRQQGVKDGLISSVYKQLGIPFTGGQQQGQQQDQQTQAQGQQQIQPSQTQGQTSTSQQGQTQQTSTQSSTQTTTSDPTAPDANNMANRALGGNPEGGNNLTRGGLAGVIKGAQNAWERGARGPGEAWGSLADPGTGKTVKIKGNDNKNYQYTKQGTQWIDAQGNAVSDPAQIAMLNKQAAGQRQPAKATQTKTTTAPAATTTAPTATTTAAPQEPITIGGQKIMPTDPAYAKIMKGVKPTATTSAAPTDATATTAAATQPAAKKHTGGKVAGQLSQTPGAIRRRQARSAKRTGATAPVATTAAPKFGPGVSPQMTAAPSKVSYNINLPKSPAAPAKAVQTAGKINHGSPVVEQIDIAEVLWRKMKSKK